MKLEIAPKETEIQANWNAAKLYCFALNANNKIGWRLPTKEELNQIYRSANDFEEHAYWSSTEDKPLVDGNYIVAWCRIFDKQGLHANVCKTLDSGYVRAVIDL